MGWPEPKRAKNSQTTRKFFFFVQVGPHPLAKILYYYLLAVRIEIISCFLLQSLPKLTIAQTTNHLASDACQLSFLIRQSPTRLCIFHTLVILEPKQQRQLGPNRLSLWQHTTRLVRRCLNIDMHHLICIIVMCLVQLQKKGFHRWGPCCPSNTNLADRVYYGLLKYVGLR